MNYSQFFAHMVRPDSTDSLVGVKDNAPEKLILLIKQIHHQHFYRCAQNDWIYKTIWEAFADLEENSIDECNIKSDTWNNQITLWLHKNCNAFALELCEECQENCDNENTDILTIIGEAQCLAKHRIYHAVNDFMKERENV